MESPISNPVTKDFQVAGVSRSGRVRKKSSKLLDFESPEEIEKRTKRPGRQPARYPGRGRPPNALREREQELALAYAEEEDEEDELEHNHNISDEETAIPTIGGTADLRGALMNSDDEVDTLVQDLVEGVEAEASYTNDSRVRQSLYMREKSNNKRKLLKDNKLQRKDKVRARYTAYSLWMREVRKRDFPDLDSANAARRLSELWANVSNREKNAWRRKAKVLAAKARTREYNAPAEVATAQTPSKASNGSASVSAATPDSSFVNRATTSRTKKLAADRRQLPEQATTPTTWAQSRQKRSNNSRIKAIPAATSQASPSTRQSAAQLDMELASGKVTPSSIEAIDAAAHLKLLGESLTVIGERLKEHNGHVALSGSLSVLLDSLLCSMGPLLCMTTQIPGLENKTQLSTNLATTLDNIAYVMPGL
ncbi:HMG box-containing protein 4 [Drosophila mojavensis]|uniref:HMG box domain-containing protein n=1 Tax=Drosophila mojavensis TaxID=7230 RepID=B4L7U4_DROMO|nr:HMG box-containing protein 4 [Drosophila mojavensis]EDW05519.1 uncharacterized protein Dmoj_GI11048 [Drosophila mojavensis]